MSYDLTTMQSIYHGQDEIVEITYNNSPVYQKSSGPDYTEPFYVENITNNTETLNIAKTGTPVSVTIEYSTNRINWNTLGTTGTTALTYELNPGDKIYLRAEIDDSVNGTSKYTSFTGFSKVGGNVMSLLYGSSFTGNERTFTSAHGYTFYGLFYGNTSLLSSECLLLPADTLLQYCYFRMFADCSSMTTAPELHSTTLAHRCYANMFLNCTALINPPTSLPATTLVNQCYYYMFQSCSSMTTAPELPATILAEYCYQDMFWGCSSLNYVECLATDISATQCLDNWMRGVSSTGTFVKKTGVTWPTGASGIPSGWTVIEA